MLRVVPLFISRHPTPPRAPLYQGPTENLQLQKQNLNLPQGPRHLYRQCGFIIRHLFPLADTKQRILSELSHFSKARCIAAGNAACYSHVNESVNYDLAGRDLGSLSVNVGRVFYGGCHFAYGAFPDDRFRLCLAVSRTSVHGLSVYELDSRSVLAYEYP